MPSIFCLVPFFNLIAATCIIIAGIIISKKRKVLDQNLKLMRESIDKSREAFRHYKSGLYTVLDLLGYIEKAELIDHSHKEEVNKISDNVRQSIINTEVKQYC